MPMQCEHVLEEGYPVCKKLGSFSLMTQIKRNIYKCYICPPGFQIPHLTFFPIRSSFLFLFFFHSFIHFISLPSSFRISPLPFSLSLSLSLSHFATSIPQGLNGLSLLIAHSASSFLSFSFHLISLSLFPHLNLAIIFLSLGLSLQRYSGISSVIHLSYFLLYLVSFILFLLLSLLLLRVFFSFRSSIPLVPFKLCRSLPRFHSLPIPLTLFPHYVTCRFSVHS
jgi:hypothetical protein